MKRGKAIKTILMVSYGLLAMFSIATLAGVANVFLENRFSAFVESRIATEKNDIVETLSASWAQHRAWNHNDLSSIGMAVLERGFIIRITESDGTVVWDARTHNHGLCEQMLTNLAATMDQRYKGWTGNYQEDTYALHGTLAIGYYGPFWFTEAELFFLGSLNTIIAATAGLILLAALILGSLMAKGLARPLEALTQAATDLAHQRLETPTPPNSGIKEIDGLSTSLGVLATKLKQQQALRRRLVSDISHELRTPLSTMQGQLEAMIDGIWPTTGDHLAGILHELHRLTRLVGQIEGLASAEEPSVPLEQRHIELGPWLGNLAAGHQHLFAQKGIQFQLNLENPSTVVSNADMLTQILVNLLTNAARYTAPGGTVTLSCQGSTLQVSDTGCGIPPEDLPHIFQRFYRVDPSRSSSSGGAGIGLTIAESLATALGTKIQVESQPGKGSRFWLTLANIP